MTNMNRLLIVVVVAATSLAAAGQQAQKTLTNVDVINMVKSKLPESVVIQAIQSHPGKFNTSATALIALHKAGVTESEMNAMMAASSGQSGVAAGQPANNSAAGAPA